MLLKSWNYSIADHFDTFVRVNDMGDCYGSCRAEAILVHCQTVGLGSYACAAPSRLSQSSDVRQYLPIRQTGLAGTESRHTCRLRLTASLKRTSETRWVICSPMPQMGDRRPVHIFDSIRIGHLLAFLFLRACMTDPSSHRSTVRSHSHELDHSFNRKGISEMSGSSKVSKGLSESI